MRLSVVGVLRLRQTTVRRGRVVCFGNCQRTNDELQPCHAVTKTRATRFPHPTGRPRCLGMRIYAFCDLINNSGPNPERPHTAHCNADRPAIELPMPIVRIFMQIDVLTLGLGHKLMMNRMVPRASGIACAPFPGMVFAFDRRIRICLRLAIPMIDCGVWFAMRWNFLPSICKTHAHKSCKKRHVNNAHIYRMESAQHSADHTCKVLGTLSQMRLKRLL